MRFGLGLDMTGKGAAGGGGSPVSVTHFWTPADMTFNGSNQLTAITDQVAASSAYIVISGTLTGDTTNGVAINELQTSSQYVGIENIIPLNTLGTHIAIMFRRSAVADDRAAVIESLSGGRGILARNSQASAAKTLFECDPLRADATDITGAFTQDAAWDLLFGDTTQRVALLKDARHTEGTHTIFRLLASALSTQRFEGDLQGFAVFTDWAEADAVSDAIKAGSI